MKYLLAPDILVLRSRSPPLNLCRKRFVSTFKADKYYVFRTLGLNTFSDTELRNSYREIFSRESKGNLESGLRAVLLRKEKGGAVNSEEEVDEKVRQLAAYLRKKGRKISYADFIIRPSKQSEEVEEESPGGVPPRFTYEIFKSRMIKSAEQLDSRVPAVSVSCALAGTSTGIIIPCMPILVQTIGMPPSEFGLVIAAFGLSKLLGNIPSAYFVDTYGRKPVMVAGLILCSVGLGGIGLTLVDGFGTPWLILMRLVSGLGVSAFSGGLNMLLSDISTGLNRTRTYAPVLSSYQAGTALGPALGGLMMNNFGIAATYFTVGGAFAVMASLNQILLKETMPGKTIYQKIADEKRAEERTRTSPSPPSITGSSITDSSISISNKQKSSMSDVAGSFKITLLSWKELMKDPALRDLMILHGAYWTALAGTSMTLLPLLMVGPNFNLGATEIGLSFAFMSLVSVASSQPVAILSDKYGKINCMISGCTLIAGSMVMLPHAVGFYQLLAAIVPLSVGGVTMGATPNALVNDLVNEKERSHAMALLRTTGDLGLLLGATAGGFLAGMSSIEAVITGNGALMAGATIWYAYNRIGPEGILALLKGDKTTPDSGSGDDSSSGLGPYKDDIPIDFPDQAPSQQPPQQPSQPAIQDTPKPTTQSASQSAQSASS